VDPLSGLCIGCGRTIGEISLWPEMNDYDRRAVMSELAGRMTAARARASRGGRVRGRADARERPPWR
jgi:predicted Fe-S protein YdhL (DUF1289 family)